MHNLSLMGQPQFVSFCVFFAAISSGFVAEAWPRPSPSSNLEDTEYNTAGSHADDSDKPTAYDRSNLFSRLWFSFLDSIIIRGYRHTLQDDDIVNMMPRKIRTAHSFQRVSRVWERHFQKCKLSKKTPSLLWVVLKSGGWSWLPVVYFALAESVLEYVQPVLLDSILGFVESFSTDKPQPTALGVILAVGMFVAAILSSMASGQYFQTGTNLGIEIKTGLTSMIYRKSLKLSPSARRKATVGEITNHMSVDAERVSQSIPFLPLIISAPFEIALATWLLYRQLGPSAFTGLGVVILLVPFQGWIAKVLNNAKDKKLAAMDGRVRLLTDILSGIKAVKFYTWEESFRTKLEVYRKEELKYLARIGLTTALMMIMYSSLPSLMALLSFVVYAVAGGPNGTNGVMSAQVVFVSITLFNRLSKPIGRASQIIEQSISLNVAVKRIQVFLLQEEIDESQVQRRELLLQPSTKESGDTCLDHTPSDSVSLEKSNSLADTPIEIHNGTFSWVNPYSSPLPSTDGAEKETSPKTQTPTLSNINLKVLQGSLTVAMGRVGQGKSSLLSAIIGEMYKQADEGYVQVNGTIAYIAQEAWIMNCSVRDNILFGKPLDQDRYQRILQACSLLQDLEILPAGDQTEIGERGINLSGGQKQRVSLARAAYQDADIYLLDDPLSAVDAHVDHHLWSNLIGPQGLLKNKTRLLITHGIHHLSEVDHIVVLKDGVIEEQGDYQSLISARGPFYQLIDEYSVIERKQHEGSKAEIISDENDTTTTDGTRGGVMVGTEKQNGAEDDDNAGLIMKEEAAEGSVGWNVFKTYCEAA
ncbi:hypothetical protein BGX27_007735 [Mortierella sp. AM989]|nr:hypothetical protein BGX27_007735 [Mortierella sp. AM989]